jgi:hypothetical protein
LEKSGALALEGTRFNGSYLKWMHLESTGEYCFFLTQVTTFSLDGMAWIQWLHARSTFLRNNFICMTSGSCLMIIILYFFCKIYIHFCFVIKKYIPAAYACRTDGDPYAGKYTFLEREDLVA